MIKENALILDFIFTLILTEPPAVPLHPSEPVQAPQLSATDASSSKAKMRSGGLPITARVPQVRMGRSIIAGYSTIARKISSSPYKC